MSSICECRLPVGPGCPACHCARCLTAMASPPSKSGRKFRLTARWVMAARRPAARVRRCGSPARGSALGCQKVAGQSVVVVEAGIVVSPDRGSAGPSAPAGAGCHYDASFPAPPVSSRRTEIRESPRSRTLASSPCSAGWSANRPEMTVSSPSSPIWRPSNQAAHWLSRTPRRGSRNGHALRRRSLQLQPAADLSGHRLCGCGRPRSRGAGHGRPRRWCCLGCAGGCRSTGGPSREGVQASGPARSMGTRLDCRTIVCGPGDAVTAWKCAGASGPFKIGLGAERAGLRTRCKQSPVIMRAKPAAGKRLPDQLLHEDLLVVDGPVVPLRRGGRCATREAAWRRMGRLAVIKITS